MTFPNRPASRLGDREALDRRYRPAESVCELPMPIESGDFRAMPRRRDRGIHQLDATQGRTRKLHHHHARINPADP